VRTYSKKAKATVKRRLESLVKGFEIAYEVKIDFDYADGYCATINTPEWSALVRESASGLLGEEALPEVEPSMAGEDFSRFLEKIPGAFYWLGCSKAGEESPKPLHDPEFFFDESALEIGIETMTKVTVDALNKLKG